MNSELAENYKCAYSLFILLKAGKSICAQKKEVTRNANKLLKTPQPAQLQDFSLTS